MKRGGAIVFKCLLRRESSAVNVFSWVNNININNYKCEGVVEYINRHHSFFCTSTNSTSQVAQSAIIKTPLDDLPYYKEKSSRFDSERDWSLEEKCDSRAWWFLHGGRRLVSHLIQVFSMSLHTNFDDYDDSPCQVYGSVNTINPQGFSSNLYTGTLTNPDSIPNNNILSLMKGRGSVVTYGHASNTILDLDLNDKSRNTVIIKKKHSLHSITEEIEDSSNKLIKDIVYGERGFVVVYYTKFLFAIYVVVEVAVFNQRDQSCPFFDVYGDIVAGYSNAREYCGNDDEVRHMKCTLFSKPFDHPQRVKNGKPMKLSRFVVALPVYASSLVIDASISDAHGQLVCGSVEFPWPGHCKKLIHDKFGTIIVLVHKRDPIGEFYSEAEGEEVGKTKEDLSTKDPEGPSGEIYSEAKDKEACNTKEHVLIKDPEGHSGELYSEAKDNEVCKTKADVSTKDLPIGVSNKFDALQMEHVNTVVSDQQRNPVPLILRGLPSAAHFFQLFNRKIERKKEGYPEELVELFSVYIGRTKPEASSIFGTISVWDSFPARWNVFERGVDNPFLLSERKKGFTGFVSIERPRQIMTHYDFRISVCLKDHIANKEVCKGEVTFSPAICKGKFFNKPLYSVVVGAHGYVILHYIFYEKAFKATVEITFLPDRSSTVPLSICGCIFAGNTNHNYSSNYEKKFYRSLLFSRPQPDVVQPDRHLRVPLSKSVVAVPKGTALVIEVDLYAVSSSNSRDVVFGKKELQMSFSKTTRAEIFGQHCHVQISAIFEHIY